MKAGNKQVFNDINITPLTDIFLVLLIIMMVVAPLLEYRQLNLAVTPPGDGQETLGDKPKSLHLMVEQAGTFTIEGVPVAGPQLAQELRKQVAEKPDGLIIETHPEAPFEAFATALDAAETAQILDVATVETDLTPPEPAPEPSKPKKTSKKK